jgi:hypothetical protein
MIEALQELESLLLRIADGEYIRVKFFKRGWSMKEGEIVVNKYSGVEYIDHYKSTYSGDRTQEYEFSQLTNPELIEMILTNVETIVKDAQKAHDKRIKEREQQKRDTVIAEAKLACKTKRLNKSALEKLKELKNELF